MNASSLTEFIKKYYVLYLIGFLVVFGLKLFYSRADSDELIWILAPTTWWVSILSGIPFTYESGIGYVNHTLRYIIAPSCSGVQFMIITIAMLVFSFMHRIVKPKGTFSSKFPSGFKGGFYWIFGSIFLSYPLTVLINGLRIITAIYLPMYLSETYICRLSLTPDKLHTLIGTTVYFISLLTIYRLADSLSLMADGISGKKQASPIRKCLCPTFWYFFIVLGIPLLNNARRNNAEQFSEYALIILSACGSILLLHGLFFFTKKEHRSIR